MHFEALEQTLRLRLVSGPVDKKIFLSVGIACPVQYPSYSFRRPNTTTRIAFYSYSPVIRRRSRPGTCSNVSPCWCCSIHDSDIISVVKFSPDTVDLSIRELRTMWVTHRSQFFLNHHFRSMYASCNRATAVIKLYSMTKSDFWFSIAWLRTSDHNVQEQDLPAKSHGHLTGCYVRTNLVPMSFVLPIAFHLIGKPSTISSTRPAT